MNKKTISILLVLFSLILPVFSLTPANFLGYQEYILNSDLVDNDLSNFIVLVELTNLDSDIFVSSQANGQDIRFSKYSNGTTDYYYEIEYYDQAGESAYIWVRIPTILSASNSTFYLFYGNATMTDGQDMCNTWTGTYDYVYHLNSSYIDSACTTNPTDNGVIPVSTSRIGNGIYTVPNDYLDLNHYDTGGYGEFQLWFKTNESNTNKYWFGSGETNPSPAGVQGVTAAGIDFSFGVREGGTTYAINSNDTVNDNTWHHAFMYWDDTDYHHLFMEGEYNAKGSQANLNPSTNDHDMNLGCFNSGFVPTPTYECINSEFDEFRAYYGSPRTYPFAWAKAEYYSQSSLLATANYPVVNQLTVRFYDIVNSAYVSGYTVLIENATTSISNYTATSTISFLNTTVPTGTKTITVSKTGYETYTNSSFVYNASTSETFNATTSPSALIVDVLDEDSSAQLFFNITVFNSTHSFTDGNINLYNQAWNETAIGDVTITIEYANDSTSYYPRNYYTTMSSTTRVNLTAYLLSTSSPAHTVNYIVQDVYGHNIEGALVTAQKLINGSYVTVEQKETDSIGVATLFQTPLTCYQMVFTHPSYVQKVRFICPSSDNYIIRLGGASSIDFTTLFDDISYNFAPSYANIVKTSPTTNETINFTIACAGGTLTSYGMCIVANETDTVYCGVGSSPSGATLIGSMNLTNYTDRTEIVAYTWFIKSGYSNHTINRTYWLEVTNSSAYTLDSAIVYATPELDDFSKIFIILVSLFAVGGVTATFGFGGGVVAVVVLGFWVAVEWFNSSYLILFGALAFGLWILKGGK